VRVKTLVVRLWLASVALSLLCLLAELLSVLLGMTVLFVQTRVVSFSSVGCLVSVND
jgi:hypothetical protein